MIPAAPALGRAAPPAAGRRTLWAAGRRALRLAARIGSGPRPLAGLVLLLTLVIRIQDPATVESLRLHTFDLFQRAAPRVLTERPVAIVDIDEHSLAEQGQWPWPRTEIARMIDNLVAAGALVVGFDVLFAEPDRTSPELFAASAGDLPPEVRAALRARPSNDHVLADVLTRTPVVLGISAAHDPDHPYADRATIATPVVEYNGDPRPFLLRYPAVIHNVDILERAAPGRGMITLNAERDGIVRRVPAALRVGEQLYPALALEMLRVATGRPHYALVSEPNGGGVQGIRIGPLDVPSDRNGLIWVRYGAHDPGIYLPGADVVANRFDPERVRGKLVLVGTSAVGLRDLRVTPVHASIPGVEIHAQLIEAVLSQQFLERPSYALGVELAVVIGLGVLLIAVVPRLAPIRGLTLVLTIGLGLVGGSWLLFDARALMLDGTYATLTSGLLFLQLAYGNYARSEAQRRQVRTAFGQFLAPALVERLVNNPEQLQLSGELRDMTFVFSDIAGFTSFTEQTDPAILVEVLNEYLDGMCQIVMDHGGTIDKIVGDAIHAIFNAPIDQPDHAARGVACALAMDAFGERFAAAKRAVGLDFGATRIGVNTGPAVVGNFGGSQRFDYTAHGDAINTAARLESANKHLGTSLCVAEATAAQAPDARFRPIGRLHLQGKQQAIGAYEPLRPDVVATPRIAAYQRSYDLLAAEDPGAPAAFAALAGEHPEDPLVALHARRTAGGANGVDLVLDQK